MTLPNYLVDQLKELLSTQEYGSKSDAIDAIVEENLYLLKEYSSPKRLREAFYRALKRRHPELAEPRSCWGESSMDALARRRAIENYTREEILEAADTEIIAENVRSQKQLQAVRDRNRIANKSFRTHARVENAIEEYSKALLEAIEQVGDQMSD